MISTLNNPERFLTETMARPCASCAHAKREEIDRKLKAGVSFIDVERWLAESGQTITAQSIGRHAKDHLGVPSVIGRRPPSGDFLESVRDAAAEGLASGELAVSLKDGIAAQKAIDARLSRNADRDLALHLAAILSGNRVPTVQIIDGEWEELDDEFTKLLNPGESA